MSIVMVRRLLGFHARLERALKDERSRPRPDDREIARIKKMKLAIKDRLSLFGGASMWPSSY